MDKLELYRSIVTEILTKYSQYKPSYGQVEIEQIFDRDHDRYLLLAIGWNQQKRIYGTTIHLDIQDERISGQTHQNYILQLYLISLCYPERITATG